jgi:hypothetical protein
MSLASPPGVPEARILCDKVTPLTAVVPQATQEQRLLELGPLGGRSVTKPVCADTTHHASSQQGSTATQHGDHRAPRPDRPAPPALAAPRTLRICICLSRRERGLVSSSKGTDRPRGRCQPTALTVSKSESKAIADRLSSPWKKNDMQTRNCRAPARCQPSTARAPCSRGNQVNPGPTTQCISRWAAGGGKRNEPQVHPGTVGHACSPSSSGGQPRQN